MNKPLVTIGVPIYKRLEYLPNVLSVIAAQDYPNIELLVSDNGLNGNAVPEIVNKHYPRPYRFRQNAATVSGSAHFNQVIHDSHGEYVVILADDDEISPNFVSDLFDLMQRYPQALAAFGVEEVIDLGGNVLRRSRNTVPELMSGEEFIRTTWGTRAYAFESMSTFLAKKETLVSRGCFPDIWNGTSDEDLLMVKIALDSHIAFSTRSAFRKRFYETSFGYAQGLQDLARGIREFIALLDGDDQVARYAAAHPALWKELRHYLVRSAWDTYYYRWSGMYRKRLSPLRWVAAAGALPKADYSGRILSSFAGAVVEKVQKHFPQAYHLYRTIKTRFIARSV